MTNDKEYYESVITALIRNIRGLELDILYLQEELYQCRGKNKRLNQEMDEGAIRIIEVKEDEDG